MTLGTPEQQQHPAGARPPGPASISFGQIGGRPAELVVAALLFAGAAIYLAIDALIDLGNVFDLFDIDYFGSRVPLYFLSVVITYVFVAAALLGTAWLLVNADPRGRILAVIIALAWTIGMIASGDRYIVPGVGDGDIGTALPLILGLIAVLVGAALTFLPGAHAAFAANTRTDFPTVGAARIALVALAALTLIQGVFFLIAAVGDGGKDTAAGIIIIVSALAAAVVAQQLATRRIEVRLALSVWALAAFITVLILGTRYFLIVFLLAALLIVPIILWLVSDVRRFFGEKPIALSGLPPAPAPTSSDAQGHTAQMPAVGSSQPFSRPQPGAHACHNCGAALQEGDSFCSSCGTPVPQTSPEPAARVCGSCGRVTTDDSTFCAGCGSKLDEPAATAAAVQACTNCGATLDPGARFCGTCGTPAGGQQ